MNCPYCNNAIQNPNALFCDTCGARVKAENNVQEPTCNTSINPQPQQPAYHQPAFQQPNYNIGKYCQKCRYLCDPNASICVNCGMSFKEEKSANDNPETLMKVISFLVPIIGLILYITKSSDEPVSAKAYGKWALIGFIINSAIVFVSYFFLFILYYFI